MENKITGIIALAMLLVFLGNYLIKIASLPLGAIIVAVLIMPIYDFVQSLRDQRGEGA